MTKKITDLAVLSPADSDTDLLNIVDVDDTTMAATGTNKKLTLADLRSQLVNSTPSQSQVAQLKSITLYPSATDGSGDHDAILFKSASSGHADHGIAFSSLLFANGHYDPVMNWGYNFNPSGTRRNNAEPAYCWQLEADYDDGTFHQMETYLSYTNAAGTATLRPIFVQANRNNDTITTLIAGSFINLNGWLGTTVNGDTLVLTGKNVFVKDNSAQPGGSASEIHVEKNGYAWGLQATNPAGRFGANELRLPYIDTSDRIYSDGLGAAKVEHAIDNLVLSSGYTPTGSADAAGNTGWVKYDASFIYVKTGAGAWKRAALSTF